MTNTTPLRGIFAILGTCFNADESIDYQSQERLISYCVEGGLHGLVTLANASEGHLMSDPEKRELVKFVVEKARGRVAVVVTVNHPSAYCAADMAKFAQDSGADAVMCMPPFFGRWRSGLAEIDAYFKAINDALTIPIIIQDHQLSDISMPADFLLGLAKRYNNIKYLKLEFGNIIHKARTIIGHPENKYIGVFGGNSGVFLPEEHEVGCCGTMPACYMPAEFAQTWNMLEAGNMKAAVEYFTPFSRLAAYEKDVANRCLWKEILLRKKVISSAAIRSPEPSFFSKADIDQLMQVAEFAGLKLD